MGICSNTADLLQTFLSSGSFQDHPLVGKYVVPCTHLLTAAVRLPGTLPERSASILGVLLLKSF